MMIQEQHDGEVAKAAFELAQKITGCRHTTIALGYFSMRADVLDGVVPLDQMKSVDDGHLFVAVHHPGVGELFKRVHEYLRLPEHYDMQSIRRYVREGETCWQVDVWCEVEPYPAFGRDVSRETEGIWIDWHPGSMLRCCHVGGRSKGDE